MYIESPPPFDNSAQNGYLNDYHHNGTRSRGRVRVSEVLVLIGQIGGGRWRGKGRRFVHF